MKSFEILANIENFINNKEINKAREEFVKIERSGDKNIIKDHNYLFLRAKLAYLEKLYYFAIDTLLIGLNFTKEKKFYDFLGDIYHEIGNVELGKKIKDPSMQQDTVDKLKKILSGIPDEKDVKKKLTKNV